MKFKLIILFFFAISQFVSGQSIREMQELKSEYEKLKKQNLDFENQESVSNLNNQKLTPNEVYISPYVEVNEKDSANFSNYYFGYEFFIKRDTLGFWENLPIPKNYILGPGDEIVVSLWGETSLRQSYIISRSGKIYDEKVGILNISGKTLTDTKEYLINQFGAIYSTLLGRKPTTFIDISLGELKSINVNFVGEVKFPGVYAIHPFSNAITGLIQAGGVDTTGTLRSIEIRRNNKIHQEIDLYDYLLKGKTSDEILLKDQDIVIVKTRKTIIYIDSLVYRPGIYESIESESISELIEYAGGLRPNASGLLSVQRIGRTENMSINNQKNQNFYIDYVESKSTKVLNGDRITAMRMLNSSFFVEMIGQVKNPGYYNFFEGMTLKDLIKLGSGFDDTTFWKSVYKNQAEIIRREPNSRYEKVIEVDLSKSKDFSEFDSYKLQNLDRFVVHSNRNFFERKNILINGEVNIPGSYPLEYDGEDLENLLKRAGGLTSKALKNGISIFRDKEFYRLNQNDNKIDNNGDIEKVRVAWKSEKITLMPGDSIVIKEKTGTINVVGEIYNPGLIEYRRGKTIMSYINDAGGLTEFGNKNGIVIIYANGVVVPAKWYRFPEILDGSTIRINRKEESEPFNVTQFATNWSQIISSLITAFILSQQISSTN